MSNWKNRIIKYGTKPASEFAPNPLNPRRHPQAQRDAVKASLDTLGWVGVVIENKRTGLLIDGHERVQQALERNEEVPYILVDLSEEEEAQALASLDWITQMAVYDSEAIGALLNRVNADNEGVQKLMRQIVDEYSVSSSVDAPEEFGAYDENIETDYCCPKCGYSWSGKPK